MADPMTTLTDYAIALECLLFARLLLNLGWVKRLWAAAFSSVGGAALLGGTYHGFAEFLSGEHRLWLWQGMGLALAIASFFTLVTAASPLRQSGRLVLLALATAKLTLVLMLGTDLLAFALRVADYLSALVIVWLVQLRQVMQHRCPKSELLWITVGVTLSGLAASVLTIPRSGWWAHPIDPMVGYHLVQMVALYCIYRSASTLGSSQ